MYNRRSFLKLTCAATVGGVITGGNLSAFGQKIARKQNYFPLPTSVYSEAVTAFSRQTFEPLLDTVFTFNSEESGESVSMRLVEIVGDEGKSRFLNKYSADSFNLIFEVEGKNLPDEKIYSVAHNSLREFPMFVSTVGRSNKRFQAVFSRVYF